LDNVVLTRVSAVLDDSLRGAVLEAVRPEPPARFRWVFRLGDRSRSIVVSLDPCSPWVGRRPGASREGPPSAFASVCSRRLRGSIVARVGKPDSGDRRLELGFTDGQAVVAELSGPSPEIVLLDAERRVVVRAGRGRAAGSRLVPGEPYRPRAPASGRIDPFQAEAATIDARLAEERERGALTIEAALRRALVGIGDATAGIVARESGATALSAGTVLVRRLAGLVAGREEPWIESPWPVEEVARRGDLDLERFRLLPWDPGLPGGAAAGAWRGSDAAETAGRYHDARDCALALGQRAAALAAILDGEAARLRQTAIRIAVDAERFRDAEIWRLRGEAVLAGWDRARRVGETVLVPDPYRSDGALLEVPAVAGAGVGQVAEACFRNHRRFRRGREHALGRARLVATRLAHLEELRSRPAPMRAEDLRRLEHEMQAAGIAVGLEPARPRPAGGPERRPRIEGARVLRSRDGRSVLVGKSGRDNARLTFVLAGSEDFWLHARGVAGAHVVVRNEGREASPPPATLEQAAAWAAWYSEARSQAWAEVQWTRRKYVRKVRGAPPGTVRLKKFATVRVRPAPPPGPDGDPGA